MADSAGTCELWQSNKSGRHTLAHRDSTELSEVLRRYAAPEFFLTTPFISEARVDFTPQQGVFLRD